MIIENSEPGLSAERSRLNDSALAVYVHTPFCPSKCGYCDFNSYAMSGEIMERTTRAIIAEIERSPSRGRPAKTIFFGGGTPTFLAEDQLLRILDAVMRVQPPVEGAEITSEANPGTADATKFSAMRRAGFNRVSLGAQSFLDSDLLRLGRIHKAGEIERAVDIARNAGFENLNLDLMFALPGQSLHAWRSNLDRALAMQPEHISLYCLTLEPNTPFYKQHLSGQLQLPDDEDQVTMYNECCEVTAAHGYAQYEISNFAKSGYECKHNLCYWHAEEYAGYGPGAVGCVKPLPLAPMVRAAEGEGVGVGGMRRYTNLKHPDRYCAAVESGHRIAFESEVLTEELTRMERIMLGLRLNDGLPVQGLELDGAKVTKMLDRGWLENYGTRIRLTREGRHFCSEVALELI